MGPIYIIDEIVAKGSHAAEVRQRYLDDYAPTAEARGMVLTVKLVSPPVLIANGQNRLTFIWKVDDLPGWWRMRIAGSVNAELVQFWSSIEPMIVSRQRSSHTEVIADV